QHVGDGIGRRHSTSLLLPCLSAVWLPTGLDHAGDFSAQRQLAEADTAQIEFAKVAARPAATEAPVAMPAGELDRLLGGFGLCNALFERIVFGDLGGSSHSCSSRVTC